jgi:high-affinity Fe2+/Pb2+ permease
VLELASLGAASAVTAGLVIVGGAAAGAAAAYGLYRLLKKLKSQPAK